MTPQNNRYTGSECCSMSLVPSHPKFSTISIPNSVRVSLLTLRSCDSFAGSSDLYGSSSLDLEWFGITIFNLLRNELLLFWFRCVNAPSKFIVAIAVAYYFCHFLDGICDTSIPSTTRESGNSFPPRNAVTRPLVVRALSLKESKIDLRVEHWRNAT